MDAPKRRAEHVGGPLVSHPVIVIGVPCYNEERFLAATLASIERQSRTDFKVLIADNASTDRTGDIARSMADRDPRFVYHRHRENIGSCGNFNFTREVSDSPYLVWIGGHDLIEPDFLARHLDALDADPSLSLSQSRHAWIAENDDVVEIIWDGELGSPGRDSLTRYLRSVSQNRHNIGANSVIRRAFLDDLWFTTVVGTDRILLSHLAYRGPYADLPDVLYKRRTFASSREDYMARLTGGRPASLDWTSFAHAYADDLISLHGHRVSHRALRFMLWGVLRYYLPVKQGTLVTSLLWTVRRVIKRLPFARPYRPEIPGGTGA